MSFDGTGHVRRATGNEDGYFALQILAGQIVVVQFWNREAEADEDSVRLDILGGVRCDAEHGIIAEFHRLALVRRAANRGTQRVSSIRTTSRPMRLAKTVNCRGLQTRRAELLDHVIGGFFKPGAAGIAAFELVVGEELHV